MSLDAVIYSMEIKFSAPSLLFSNCEHQTPYSCVSGGSCRTGFLGCRLSMHRTYSYAAIMEAVTSMTDFLHCDCGLFFNV